MMVTGTGVRRERWTVLVMVAIVVGVFAGALVCSTAVAGAAAHSQAVVAHDEPAHRGDVHHVPDIDSHDSDLEGAGAQGHADHGTTACLIEIRLTTDAVVATPTHITHVTVMPAAPPDACTAPEPPIPRSR